MSKLKKNLGDMIGGLSRHTLYLMLFVATSIPLFFRVEVPNTKGLPSGLHGDVTFEPMQASPGSGS